MCKTTKDCFPEGKCLAELLIAISAMESSTEQHGDKNQLGNMLMISESMGAGGSPDIDQ